jgi:hypothetical protein
MRTRADWKPSSREGVRGIAELHVRPKLGGYPLGALTHSTIQEWAGSLSPRPSPASVRRVVNVVSGSLQMAVDDGRPPASRSSRRGWFHAAPARIGQPGLTPHELRHTAASLAISSGANVKAVQRMLAHAFASVSLDVYADLFDSDLDPVSAALDDAIVKTNVAILLPRVEPPGTAQRPKTDLICSFLWSPLSDSNRRPPLYKWSRVPFRLGEMARKARKFNDFVLVRSAAISRACPPLWATTGNLDSEKATK